MAIVGLLLLAAAIAVGAETVNSNWTTDVVEVFGTRSAVPTSVIFLFGALCATVAIFGLQLITGAFQRRRRNRVDAKHRMRREETETRLTDIDGANAELVEENDRLRAELAAERRAAATLGGVAVPPGAGNVAYGDQVSDAVRSDTISQTGHFEPYPIDRGTDGVINTEAMRTHDTAGPGTEEHAGFTGRLRGNP